MHVAKQTAKIPARAEVKNSPGLNSPVCPQPVFKRMHTETAMTTTARKADVSIGSYTPGILSKASRISLLFADDDEMLIEILAF